MSMLSVTQRRSRNGTNAKQLTDGTFDVDPVCSRDGKWVYYYASAARRHPAMRVPLEGGAPELVAGGDVPNMYGMGAGQAISPDGQTLVFNAELRMAWRSHRMGKRWRT